MEICFSEIGSFWCGMSIRRGRWQRVELFYSNKIHWFVEADSIIVFIDSLGKARLPLFSQQNIGLRWHLRWNHRRIPSTLFSEKFKRWHHPEKATFDGRTIIHTKSDFTFVFAFWHIVRIVHSRTRLNSVHSKSWKQFSTPFQVKWRQLFSWTIRISNCALFNLRRTIKICKMSIPIHI